MTTRVLVTGAGGFIGHHLVTYLKAQAATGSAASTSSCPSTPTSTPTSSSCSTCAAADACLQAMPAASTTSTRWRPTWAAWASSPRTTPTILHNNALINLHTLEAARQNGVQRYLYTSSACVYPEYLQTDADVTPAPRGGRLPGPAAGRLRLGEARHREALRVLRRRVRDGDAHRPLPQHLRARTAPTTAGARRRRPRCAARSPLAEDGGEIEIWGDGEQTRSFCYIDDCVEGIYRLMQSDYREPLNLGTDRMVTINELARIVIDDRRQARHLASRHVDGPAGRPRPQLRQHPAARGPRLGAGIDLEEGLADTYRWIEKQVAER